MQSRYIVDKYKIGEDTGLICPLTNLPLLYNGDSRYIPKGGPLFIEYYNIILDNMFKLDTQKVYDMMGNTRKMSRELSRAIFNSLKAVIKSLQINGRTQYFKLLEDKTWECFINVSYVGYLPFNTSEDEIQRLVKEDNEKYERLKAEYLADPKGKMFFFRITAKSILLDTVPVVPMSAPIGNLRYLDYIHDSNHLIIKE